MTMADSMRQAETSCVSEEERKPVLAAAHGREWAAVIALTLIAAILRLWRLDQNGYGNPYYAAAARSMLASWGNFFFGAFDPTGFITVDKPPAALWVQALSARLLGYSGISLLLPQALMGVVSVVLTYGLVRRAFGPGAGLLAGLIAAITPIGVAVDRDNLPDTALVLVLLLSAWALLKATETGRLRWLLLSMALVGVGFNVKMLAAYVVLPTFYLLYLWAAPISRRARLVHLAAATVVLGMVSLSWSLAVELTPKNQRPYIGGSRNNSALDLALGYNGLGRVFGGSGNLRPPGGPRRPPANLASAPFPPGPPRAGFPPFPPGGGFRGGPPGFGGIPGPFRFAGRGIAGQITWLFPLALLGALAAASRVWWRSPLAQRPPSLVLWGGWFGTHFVVFSFARGIFHEYYTVILVPAVAALAGAGTVALWEESRRDGWRRALLPTALILTAAWQAYLICQSSAWRPWLLPLVLGGAGAGVLGLVALGRRSIAWAKVGTGVGLAALLIGPSTWSLAPVLAKGNPVIPVADPSALTGQAQGMPPMPPFAMDGRDTGLLVAFLRANRHGERYFVAAPSCMEVGPVIIETGESAISLGGFMGADPVLSRDQFAALVAGGQLRFVLLGGGPGGGGPPGGQPGPGGPMGPGNQEIITWVREHGKPVDPKLWRADEPSDQEDAAPPLPPADDTGPPTGPMPLFGRMRTMRRLYDCRPELGLVTPPVTAASDAGVLPEEE